MNFQVERVKTIMAVTGCLHRQTNTISGCNSHKGRGVLKSSLLNQEQDEITKQILIFGSLVTFLEMGQAMKFSAPLWTSKGVKKKKKFVKMNCSLKMEGKLFLENSPLHPVK